MTVLIFLVAFTAELRAAGDVGSPAPDFEFIHTWNMGEQTRLSSYRGSVVLLETFATW